jgi:hypothetical protein
MTRYCIYQRDLITGHMNVIATIHCTTDLEAVEQSRAYTAGKETLLCNDGQVIAQFCRRPQFKLAS